MATDVAPPERSDIARRQAEPEFITMMRAYSHRYDLANRIRSLRQSVAAGLAIATPVVALVSAHTASVLGACAAVWLLLDRVVLLRAQIHAVNRAVAAHELYDTQLFRLPWNRSLAGRQPAPEDLSDDARKKPDKPEYRTWYTEPTGLARPADVLVCQRQNARWTRRLRRGYATLLLTAAAAWLILGVLYGIWRDITLADYLAQVLLPATPGYLMLLDLAAAHRDGAEHAAVVEDDLSHVLARVVAGRVTIDDCRNIQDDIYRTRRDYPPGPEWYYRLRREKDQRAIDDGVQAMIRKLSGPPASPVG